MPVNFLEIRTQVKEMTRRTLLEQKRLGSLLERASETLERYADKTGELGKIVEKAAAADKHLRCARPLYEGTGFCAALAASIPAIVLLAADGSQINPSRHDPVQFGLVNAGAIRMQPGSGMAPQEVTRSRLLYAEDIVTRQGPISEEEVTLQRDLLERLLLAELAEKESLPVVALTDGTLELFREPRQTAALRKAFKDFQDALAKLAARKIITAGYVDKPRSDLLVRLLELAEIEGTSQEASPHPFQGLSDRKLLEGRLQAGERSGIFAIQSLSAKEYEPHLAPCFFYLNVGQPGGKPHLARIEIPTWMAGEEKLLSILQFTLAAQCRSVGARPYPYILHRAHEVAVVSLQEKERLQEMVQSELRGQGVEVDEKSFKQDTKDSSGNRTRYKK